MFKYFEFKTYIVMIFILVVGYSAIDIYHLIFYIGCFSLGWLIPVIKEIRKNRKDKDFLIFPDRF